MEEKMNLDEVLGEIGSYQADLNEMAEAKVEPQAILESPAQPSGEPASETQAGHEPEPVQKKTRKERMKEKSKEYRDERGQVVTWIGAEAKKKLVAYADSKQESVSNIIRPWINERLNQIPEAEK